MANDIQIKKRIQVIKENMLSLLKQISNDYQNGKIKSPAELQNIVYHSLQQFYQSIGSPTLDVIKAWGPPYSKDHNQMMEQVLYDLHTLYSEIKYMSNDIHTNFEQVEMERQSFTYRINEIESQLTSIRSGVAERTDLIIWKDDFTNSDRYLKEAVRGSTAYVSADEGIATLHRISGEEFNTVAQATIIKGSGLPGNTHVVKTKNGALKFEGEENLHINLADILDGNSDTWFEYEKFQLTDQGELITENKNLRYEEPIYWMENDLYSINLVIEINLATAKDMNWLSLSPFIPSERGATPATIEKIVISDEKGDHQSLTFEESFDKTKAFIFPKQECKTITLYLRQDTGYPVDIGHFYFKQLDNEDVNILDIRHEHDGVRVHGVDPSVQNLGINYDTGKKEIVYPIYEYGDTIEGEITKKRNLFTRDNVSSIGEPVFSGLEKAPSFRYMIGIRDTIMASYEFASSSQYVSTPFISSIPIKEISLDAIVDVPNVFGEGEWLKYFISVDEGKEWYRIHPLNIFQSGIKTKYLFNSKTPKEGRVEEYGYIETETEVHQVQVKIEFSRPIDDEESRYYTPVVYEYELHALT